MFVGAETATDIDEKLRLASERFETIVDKELEAFTRLADIILRRDRLTARLYMADYAQNLDDHKLSQLEFVQYDVQYV